MLYAIALLANADGTLRALAPDLDHCDLAGTTGEELLPRLRLAIEAELTRLLVAGLPLPGSRDGLPPDDVDKRLEAGSGVRWLTVHINLRHLEALARHQAPRQADR